MRKLKLLFVLSISLNFFTMAAQNFEVWVSDAGGFNNPPWFIYKYDDNGENSEEVMNQSDQIEWPEDIFFLEDENAVLISNLASNGNISKHNIDTGDFIEIFAEITGGPTRMKLGVDGLLYILQWSSTTNKVLRYQLDGTFVDEFTSIGVPQSIGLDWDIEGNLYVSSYGGSYIQKFDPDGNDLGPFINTGLSGPTNIFFDKSGNGDLIVFNWSSGVIKRFDSNGDFIEDLITGVGQCEGVDFLPNGDILIGVGLSGSVKRYDSEFNFIEDFITAGTLLTPNAIAIRDLTLAIPENELDENFITPTIGNRFSLISNQADKINSLLVYNISGKLIDEIIVSKTPYWDAKQFSNGLYYIKAISENGSSVTQKILVKN